MKKIFLLTLFAFWGVFFLNPRTASATSKTGSCSWVVTDQNGKEPPFEKIIDSYSTLRWTVGSLNPNNQYSVYYGNCLIAPCNYSVKADSMGKVTGTFQFHEVDLNKPIIFSVKDPRSVVNPICTYTISSSEWYYKITPTPKPSAKCSLGILQGSTINPRIINSRDDIILHGTIIQAVGLKNYAIYCHPNIPPFCTAKISGPFSKSFTDNSFTVDNTTPKSFEINAGRNWPSGTYTATAKVTISYWDGIIPKQLAVTCPVVGYNVGISGGVLSPYPTPSGPGPYPSLAPICKQLPSQFQLSCKNCTERQGKIWTAIGCVSPDLGNFISQYLLVTGVGIAGGIAFLYFLYGSILFMTSQGNAEQIAKGREIIMSSLIGLLFIIFSVFLLKVIAVDILDLKWLNFG